MNLVIDIQKAIEKEIKKSKKGDESEPPAWFNNYVKGVKMEESKISTEKKPVKIIKEEAKSAAAAHWNNNDTRDRVSNEVDNHMNRLYGMIFSRK